MKILNTKIFSKKISFNYSNYNIFLETDLSEYLDLTKFYIERIFVILINHLESGEKFFNLEILFSEKIFEDFKNEIKIKFDLKDCNLTLELFEDLYERMKIKFQLYFKSGKFFGKFESSEKM